MGSRCQEELVLEVSGEYPDGLRAEGVERVVAGCRRGYIVSLVDHEDVKRSGVCRVYWQDIAEHPHRPVPLQPVDRRHKPREVGPWVRVDSARTSQLFQQSGVNDPELQAELF